MPGVLGPADVIHLDGFGRGEGQPPVVASACCGAGGGAGDGTGGGLAGGGGRGGGNGRGGSSRTDGDGRDSTSLICDGAGGCSSEQGGTSPGGGSSAAAQRQTTGKQPRMPGVLGPADVIHLDGFGRGESQPPVVASACCGAGSGVGIGGFKLGVGRIVGNDVGCERAGVFVDGGGGRTRWWGEWKAHVAWGEGFGGTGPGLGCEGLSAAAGEVCGAAVGGASAELRGWGP